MKAARSRCGICQPGQPPALYTEAEGWSYLRIWGMGIASL